MSCLASWVAPSARGSTGIVHPVVESRARNRHAVKIIEFLGSQIRLESLSTDLHCDDRDPERVPHVLVSLTEVKFRDYSEPIRVEAWIRRGVGIRGRRRLSPWSR